MNPKTLLVVLAATPPETLLPELVNAGEGIPKILLPVVAAKVPENLLLSAPGVGVEEDDTPNTKLAELPGAEGGFNVLPPAAEDVPPKLILPGSATAGELPNIKPGVLLISEVLAAKVFSVLVSAEATPPNLKLFIFPNVGFFTSVSFETRPLDADTVEADNGAAADSPNLKGDAEERGGAGVDCGLLPELLSLLVSAGNFPNTLEAVGVVPNTLGEVRVAAEDCTVDGDTSLTELLEGIFEMLDEKEGFEPREPLI